MIALNGDPRTAGAALGAVFAAAMGNGGSISNVQKGIDFFAKLKQVGNFVPVDATPSTVASGQTPITIDWDYLQLGYKQEVAKQGITWQVVVPAKGVYGAFYAQAINATGPNPSAAKLWEEFLYSDQGQLLFLKGGRPSGPLRRSRQAAQDPRLDAEGAAAGVAYKNVKFASDAQQTKGKNLVAAQWGSKVAGS